MEFIGHISYCHYNKELFPREVAVKSMITNQSILFLVDLSNYCLSAHDTKLNRWCEENIHGLPTYPGDHEPAIALYLVAHVVRQFLNGAVVSVVGKHQAKAFAKMGCETFDLQSPPIEQLQVGCIPPPTHAHIHRAEMEGNCSMCKLYCIEQFVGQLDSPYKSLEFIIPTAQDIISDKSFAQGPKSIPDKSFAQGPKSIPDKSTAQGPKSTAQGPKSTAQGPKSIPDTAQGSKSIPDKSTKPSKPQDDNPFPPPLYTTYRGVKFVYVAMLDC